MDAAPRERHSPRQHLPSPGTTITCWSLNPLWKPKHKREPIGQCHDPLSGVKTSNKAGWRTLKIALWTLACWDPASPSSSCLTHLSGHSAHPQMAKPLLGAVSRGLTWGKWAEPSRLTLPLQRHQLGYSGLEDKTCFHYKKKSTFLKLSLSLIHWHVQGICHCSHKHSLFMHVIRETCGVCGRMGRTSKLSRTVKPSVEGGEERQREEWEGNALNKAEECAALSSCCWWWAEQAHVMWSAGTTTIITQD